jgi:signal transduction histidine kinase
MSDESSSSIIKTGRGGDLAFSVIVGASYLTMFGAGLPSLTTGRIALLICLGIVYLLVGIYAYAYAARTGSILHIYSYFLIQIPLSAVIIYISRGPGFNALLMLPLAGHAVVLLPNRQFAWACAAIILAYFLAIRLWTSSFNLLLTNLSTFLAGLIFIVVFTQISVNEEKARAEVERLAIELERANRHLREYAAQVQDLTITQERNRMAREIHDGLGHYLTTIHVQIQAAIAILKTNPNKAIDSLSRAQALCEDALLDIRHSVSTLRASLEEDRPLHERLEALIDEFKITDIQTNFYILGHPRPLKPQLDLTIYRTAQEGLNNIRKHANASKISLTLDYLSEKQVKLTIEDDGAGSDDPQGGFGLLGIKERAHLLNGEVTIRTNPTQGFTLTVELPT